jgi:hypothetical protein
MRQPAIGAKPRGACPVCNQGFRPATDRQWEQRWSYHLRMSERHKKYMALVRGSNIGVAHVEPPPASGANWPV